MNQQQKLKRKATTKLDNTKRHFIFFSKKRYQAYTLWIWTKWKKVYLQKKLDSCNQEKWRQQSY